jgi:propanol-preferring alcohol dehydrogenase
MYAMVLKHILGACWIAGDGKRLGLYGFGAAAHSLAQVACWQGRRVCAFTRPSDIDAQGFARRLGAI